MGVGRDTSNVFSAPVLLVLTSSECVCCRLGEMARGQAAVLLVWPSGSAWFKVETHTVRGGFFCVIFSKTISLCRSSAEERTRHGAGRQASTFCCDTECAYRQAGIFSKCQDET